MKIVAVILSFALASAIVSSAAHARGGADIDERNAELAEQFSKSRMQDGKAQPSLFDRIFGASSPALPVSTTITMPKEGKAPSGPSTPSRQ
jgi:hypothetical protein